MRDVDGEGELVDEFVFSSGFLVVRGEAAKEVDHETRHARADPYVAVCYPDYVALCFAVCAAHVSDFGVWP